MPRRTSHQRRRADAGFAWVVDSVVAVGGIGRIVAWSAAKAVVAKYRPTVLISAGIAGGRFGALLASVAGQI